MKIMKISIALIAISSLAFLAFSSLSDLSKNEGSETSSTALDNQLLQKKWKVSHYEILGEKIPLEASEKADYIHFNNDQTYTSVSDGAFDKGNYTLVKSTITMTNSTDQGELKLNVKTLDETQLVVAIDDPNDPDAKYFNIHLKQ